MKKRIIAAVLAGMLIVSAGGCGNGTASSGNAVDNSNGMATESSADQAIASVGLPVIIYNVPGRTGLNITPPVLESLADISGLVAVKEASGNIDQLTDMISRCGERYTFYSGEDGLVLPMLALGAQGVISVLSNILPADMQKLCELFFGKEIQQAADLQIKLYPLIKALFCEVNPIPVKTAASLMGICSANMRLPLTQMEDANRARLVSAMREYGINI